MSVAQLEVEIVGKLDKFDYTIEQATKKLKEFTKVASTSSKDEIDVFNRKIKDLKDYIKSLKEVGLPDIVYKLGDDLDRVNPTLDQTNALIKKFKDLAGGASKSELAALNKEILKLQTYANGLQKLGLPNNLPDTTKRSTIALTSLNQVIQDLPFGFIGIQNNIPNLVQSFGTLIKTEGGVKKAFKSIGQSLNGATGLLFAVSAVTSGITFLIQKYGSLGDAAEVLFAKNSKLVESQKTFNKEFAQNLGNSQSEIATINILIKTINDLSKPLSDRNAAYLQLKKLQPDIAAGIKDENGLTKSNLSLINSNAQARKQLILLKAKEAAINTVINQNAAEQFKAELERPKVLKNLIKAQELYDNTRKIGFDGTENFGAILDNESKALEIAQLAYKRNIEPFNNLIALQKEYIGQLDPIVNAIAKIDENTYNLNKSLKDQLKSEKDLLKQGDEYEQFLIKRADLEDDLNRQRLRGVMTTNIKIGKDNKDNLIKYGKLVTKEPIKFFDITSFQEAYNKLFEKIRLNPPKAPIDFTPVEPGKITARMQQMLDTGLTSEQLNANLLNTGKLIFDNIINPLNQLFDVVLSKGEKSWEDFTKNVAESLKKLYVRLAAAAALAGIISLASGGGASGISFIKAFGSILGVNLGGGGNVANPSFGGVQPGGMQMAGSVNMVLRGQDLVGSLNRTNSQFSRVG